MQDILELAAKLGKRIAGDARASNMAAARNALDASLPDRQLLQQFEEQQQKFGELEREGKPIEPEHKRALADLHTKVIGSDVIKNLMKAQADYVELMTAVSREIERHSLGSDQPSEPVGQA